MKLRRCRKLNAKSLTETHGLVFLSENFDGMIGDKGEWIRAEQLSSMMMMMMVNIAAGFGERNRTIPWRLFVFNVAAAAAAAEVTDAVK